jgi:hypothetical protein
MSEERQKWNNARPARRADKQAIHRRNSRIEEVQVLTMDPHERCAASPSADQLPIDSSSGKCE